MDAGIDIVVKIESIIEPFSGARMVRVRGTWEGDPSMLSDECAVELRLDGQPATRCHLTPLDSPDLPTGMVRYQFLTQIPELPNEQRLEVVLVSTGAATRVASPPAGQPPVAPAWRRGLGQLAQSLLTGQAFSVVFWLGWVRRLARKVMALKRRIRYKLLARRYRPRSMHDAYVENTRITPRLRAAMIQRLERFQHRPTFSILVPVYNVDPRWLQAAIESVRSQIYPHWELCLADDHSTRPDLIRYLDSLPDDPRIKLARRDVNGHICQATNTAADLATGDFVCLLDNDDQLAPDALFAIAERLQDHPAADLIYSDEDKITETGRRYDPQFKPDWSPELLLSYNYINHFTVIRRSLFERAGRFRPGYEGSQDHDLLLRVTELTNRIEHIPRILYHWRALPQSTASDAGVKPIVHTSGRRAVEDALIRRGVSVTLHVPPFAQRLNLPVLALDGPDDGPAIAILIVGDPVAAARTVQRVTTNTSYRHFTTIVADESSATAESLNHLILRRSDEVLLILEAGLEPADPRWLSRLLIHLQLPGVGAVGGIIRDPEGKIIDGGPVLGMHDGIAPSPAFVGLPRDAISYYFYADVARNTSAVSGRCLMTWRSTFAELGGFDATRFQHSLWAIDYGLRLKSQGLRCVTVGGVEFHTPLPSPISRPSELLALKQVYGRLRDPFHNPNCSEHTAWQQLCDAPLVCPEEAITPPVRTLVVAHNLNNPEGAPRYLSEIVLGLQARQAIAPTVYSLLSGAGATVYQQAGIPVVVNESAISPRILDGLWSPREYERALADATQLFREHQPEVVIANTLLTFPMVDAATRAGIPAVWIIHEHYSAHHLDKLFSPFARTRIEAAFRMAARVIPASHDTARLFEHLNTRGNVRVIHNGLDPRPLDDYLRTVSRAEALRLLDADTDKKHIIAVGTVCERKGQHTLVEAAAILARERSDFVVHLIGARPGIPYTEYVRHLIARRGVNSVVSLVPETDRVWTYFRAADAFVCTSHMETFSRAVLEAEAFGLPIVSTRCAGVSEQVVWGGNAFPIDFGDAAALAEHLRRMLSNDALRRDLARESRAMFELHLNDGEMLDRYGATILAAARIGPRARTLFEPTVPAIRRAA